MVQDVSWRTLEDLSFRLHNAACLLWCIHTAAQEGGATPESWLDALYAACEMLGSISADLEASWNRPPVKDFKEQGA